MTTTKQYDFLNRLSSIATVGTGSTPSPMSYGYTYNDANQRTRATLGDLSYWVYGYDSLGQVKSGKRYWFNGTPVAGQQFEYGFDDIGNRTQTKAGGDQNGANLRTNTYTANKLNQYTSRTVPGAVDVMGAALVSKTVTVNGPTPAAYRKGEYFRKQLTVANGSAPVWHSVSVAATGETTVTGNVFVPRTPEQYDDPATPSVNEGYDLDGNQLRDGRWNYAWDAENRLKQVESLASGPTASKRKVVWEFDAQGRRIRQTTYDGSSGSYAVTEDLKLVYDGWACVAELNYADNALKRSYVSGTDLSGSLGGAGGVGGLLMVNSVANGAHFCAYDGNGNVAALVKATDATVSANYEYGPFGEPVRATGTLAKENPFRFSTKRTDNTTDLVLYEYRLYNPNTGRWPNRDPLQDAELRPDGPNLYAFVRNNPTDRFDADGKESWGPPFFPPKPPKPSPPPVNPCDGYKQFIPTPKCLCNCKLIADGYPAKAEAVCNGFMEKYEWSDKAQCVAKCLVAVEKATHKLTWCSVRATIRLSAHVGCYAECGFVPWDGLPPGGISTGATHLLGTLLKCKDPWDQAK